jgi:hypothetical protein
MLRVEREQIILLREQTIFAAVARARDDEAA